MQCADETLFTRYRDSFYRSAANKFLDYSVTFALKIFRRTIGP